MGYDMSVRNPIIPRPEVDWSDEESRQEYWGWEREAHVYLRRNIFGMAPVRDALEALGMGFWAEDYLELPGFPNAEVYGINDWDDEGNAVGERAKEYEADIAAVLRWHGPEIPGIPLHKFTSNDGWHVTREECETALVLYEAAIAAGAEHPEAFREDVIPFLRQAAQADGFEVH